MDKRQELITELKGIEILQEKISEKHNDSFWYDGHIASFTKSNGTELILIASGEIKIRDKEGYVVYDVKERNDGIRGGLNNDDDLKKIGNDYYWDMNNWFEVIFKKKGEDNFDCVLGDVAHEYDDGIELLKAYIGDEDY